MLYKVVEATLFKTESLFFSFPIKIKTDKHLLL